MNITLAAAAAALAAFAVATPAAAQTRQFDLPDFHAVDIATGISATLTVGAAQSVRAESRREDILDKLEIRVRNGVLEARIDSNFLDFIMGGGLLGALLEGRPDVRLHISVPALDGIAASSGASVEAGGVSGDRLRVRVSSGASASLPGVAVGALDMDASSGASIGASGACDTLSADASSGGSASLADLSCKTVEARASSGGSLRVHALESITARASSGGSISVSGNPARSDLSSSSGGSVGQAD